MLLSLVAAVLVWVNAVVRAAPTVAINSPQATIIGSAASGIDTFQGIPFAQPPVGALRLKYPEPITSDLGTVEATSPPLKCTQGSGGGEDCLTLNVQRPSSATSSSKFPVVFWLYGGAFKSGSTQDTDATDLITASIDNGNPIIYVSANYRVGGFGFMPGKEVNDDGAANCGLLDQRQALKWVADNIERFGGDPAKVTIWGGSSGELIDKQGELRRTQGALLTASSVLGSISVFNHMALSDGDHSYNGKPLFRAALMSSGSLVPREHVDGPKGQDVYDSVVQKAGCQNTQNTLQCLRDLPLEEFRDVTSSVPTDAAYRSVSLAYTIRPDGKLLKASPEKLVQRGLIAKVPFIVGDQEDEGTKFSMAQRNLTTTEDLQTYLSTIFFPDAPRERIDRFVATYPDDQAAGSPFRTGDQNQIYPQYKRLAAILGDVTFTLVRRLFLELAEDAMPDVPSWSYLASYDYGTPNIGTAHGSGEVHSYAKAPGFVTSSIVSYHLSFFNTMDPNAQASNLPHWPLWKEGRQLLWYNVDSNDLLNDDFRAEQYAFISEHTAALHF